MVSPGSHAIENDPHRLGEITHGIPVLASLVLGVALVTERFHFGHLSGRETDLRKRGIDRLDIRWAMTRQSRGRQGDYCACHGE